MVDFQEPIGKSERPFSRQVLKPGELFYFKDKDRNGIEPPTHPSVKKEDNVHSVGMDALAVTAGNGENPPRLEATGGDCPIITIYHPGDVLGAVIHLDTASQSASDSLLKILSDAFPEILDSTSIMTIYLSDDPQLSKVRDMWAQNFLNKLRSERNMRKVSVSHIEPGTTIILDTKTGEVTQERTEEF